VKSCVSVLELAQHHDVDVPITAAVAAVCAGRITPGQMLEMLMSRSMKSES
jgi:glycerol-3-phosphate dehydrogenase (NAD(P)+)